MIKLQIEVIIDKQRKGENKIKDFCINHQIRLSPLRVIDESGKQLGVLSKEEALKKAQEADLDLVEVSPNARPPVAKIMDLGKFRYEQTKAAKKQKQQQKTSELKEIRLGLKISQHDLEVKASKAESFLKNKNKVQIMLRFKGREITHKELGIKLLNDFIDRLEDFGQREGDIKKQGMTISVLLIPK